MSARRKSSNSDREAIIEEPLKSTILCEYYLWVRWCNIREVNGYYIYNGMKGNKLSFVHQQNNDIIIYFHTISSATHSQNEQPFSHFFSSFMPPTSSIPENREEDDNALNSKSVHLTEQSGSSVASSIRHDQSPRFSTNSNTSTPCSSPPQSPRNKPKLITADLCDDQLYNEWVIQHENDVLYHTKDHEDSIDNEYPPSYGWKYNERNESTLPRSYLESTSDLINFGAPPPGITRSYPLWSPLDSETFNPHDLSLSNSLSIAISVLNPMPLSS